MNIKNSIAYKALRRIYLYAEKVLRPFYVPIYLKKCREQQENEVARLRNTQPLRCVFLVIDDSIWKCDSIYRAMEKSPDFEPLIIACAVPKSVGYVDMIEKMEKCYNVFREKGYHVIKSYDKDKNETLNLRKLNPDIIVYTKPFDSLMDRSYYVDRFKDKLTIYVPYYINGTNDYELAYNLPVHYYCWRYYVESPFHLELARKYSYAKGNNVVVTGYPGIEDFIDPKYIPTDNWKIKDRKIKRIIWAPHQSIDLSGTVNYSTFLKYCDFMVNMAKKYNNSIQIAFKPHPLLKKRLYEKWGKERTDVYYETWNTMENSMISDSDYHDLFLTSDALIHDCGSFTIEYLYLNKPVMRLMNDLDPRTMFGDFGMACINQHYLAYSEEEIDRFINNVITGEDYKYEERSSFIKSNLRINGKLPSEVILENIISSIRS